MPVLRQRQHGDAPPSARYSLRWRLPLLVSTLIAGVLASFVWAAHREVEQTLIAAGTERAQAAADQLASRLAEPTRQRLDSLQRLAADPVVARRLRASDRQADLAMRQRLVAMADAEAEVVTLWSADGRPVVSASGPGATDALMPDRAPPLERLVRLRQAHGVIFSETVEPVPGRQDGSPPLGAVAVLRPLSATPAPDILNQLVGDGASVLLGVVGDEVWTDLKSLVAPPPVAAVEPGRYLLDASDGDARIGAVGIVGDTPWRVWVEFPRALVVAPASMFLTRILIVAGVLVWAAVILVALVAAQVTCPLGYLTEAAERIAAGDYTQRVSSHTRDEIGRLGRVFNAMSQQIAGAQQRLLQDLQARTEMEAHRRSLEDQLVQSRKMEAVGRLAGGVAHDFNNLLTAILGYSNLVLEELEPGHPARADVEHMRRAGESAAALTRQLLAFSRKQVLQPQVLDLNQVVRRTQGLLQRLIGEHIALATSLDPLLDTVNADPGQLEQVILNLALNARDAMFGGGTLSIETANVVLDEAFASRHEGATPGAHVMLAVSDTGVGMDDETQTRIFEPFFTTKRRGEGTGLGLSTVYGIVKQSGGSIWVYSEPGHGTTFRVYFPSAAQVERPPVTAPQTDGLAGSETILLAEDQPEVRSIACAVLRRYGYTVLEAGDGGEALAIVGRHRQKIHLLLSDVVMPSMSGPELARLVQAEQPGIRVLYASGYTDDAIVRHGVLDPGVAFLQKPFTPSALLRKIREMLDAPIAAG